MSARQGGNTHERKFTAAASSLGAEEGQVMLGKPPSLAAFCGPPRLAACILLPWILCGSLRRGRLAAAAPEVCVYCDKPARERSRASTDRHGQGDTTSQKINWTARPKKIQMTVSPVYTRGRYIFGPTKSFLVV